MAPCPGPGMWQIRGSGGLGTEVCSEMSSGGLAVDEMVSSDGIFSSRRGETGLGCNVFSVSMLCMFSKLQRLCLVLSRSVGFHCPR